MLYLICLPKQMSILGRGGGGGGGQVTLTFWLWWGLVTRQELFCRLRRLVRNTNLSLLTGFKLQISAIGSDRFNNCATTTALISILTALPDWKFLVEFYCKSGPNTWRLFGLFRKTSILSTNCWGPIFVNFWMNLGYFLMFSTLNQISSSQKEVKSWN